MVSELFPNIKNSEEGITLIEIVVGIFIITLFSLILFSDFPSIQRQYALSRVTYNLAQDLRKTQDLGLSGVQTNDLNRHPIAVEGYGVYFDPDDLDAVSHLPERYLIYADVYGDQKYGGSFSTTRCDQTDQGAFINGTFANPLKTDCVVDIVDVSKENPSLYIKKIDDIKSNGELINEISEPININFTPPDPIITITKKNCIPMPNNSCGYTTIEIVFGLSTNNMNRTVEVNTSGLINVK